MKAIQSIRSIILTIMLCIVCAVSMFAQTLPDEVIIDYAAYNKPLKIVLRELSLKSGVNINFSENRIPANKKISISVKNETVGDILTVILRDAGYEYHIVGNQLVILKDLARGVESHLTISGYVRDQSSDEPLSFANVYLFDKTVGTQTNEDGFYSITLPRGTQRIYYSYIGYQQAIREIFLERDIEKDIHLRPDVQLNEVLILEEVENREEETTSSEENLYVNQILSSSTLGGESDIIRLINMKPGVSTGADGLGGMNIRGGSADQNLVLLDGVPIYNPGHTLGLFSVFNSDVIKNAKLYKGNIPARFGGRLSAVLDVHTRVGNTKKTTGAVSLSTLAVKSFIEGPLGSNGSSYLVSARRTFLDPWIKSLTTFINNQPGQNGFSTYYFADLNAKVNLKINKKNTLQFSGFMANDRFNSELHRFSLDLDVEENDDSGIKWNWGNNMLSLSLKSQLSNKSFGTLRAHYTDFSFQSFDYNVYNRVVEQDSVHNYKAALFQSSIRDLSIGYDYDFLPNPKHRIRMGITGVQHTFLPGLSNVGVSDTLFGFNEIPYIEKVESLIDKPNIKGTELSGYIEDDIFFSYGTKLNIGLHTNYIITGEKNYFSLQPRIALLTQANNLYFKIGVSRMSQYLHLLSSNAIGLPSDLWLPSTGDLAPENSWIFSADLGSKNKAGYQWGIETYFKKLDRISSFSEGVTGNISDGVNWEQNIPVGQGTSYGAEVYFNKIIGRTTWNLNYTISTSKHKFPDLNTGEEFPFRFDRRHNVKLGFFHKVSDNTEFLLNMTYATGNPISFPDNIVITENEELIPIYTEKNNTRLKAYYRMDFAFNFYSKLNWAKQKFSLGLYNAFDRRNEYYIDVVRSDVGNRFDKKSYSILPIFPSISYSLYFD